MFTAAGEPERQPPPREMPRTLGELHDMAQRIRQQRNVDGDLIPIRFQGMIRSLYCLLIYRPTVHVIQLVAHVTEFM